MDTGSTQTRSGVAEPVPALSRAVLEVRDLAVEFRAGRTVIPAVDGISFKLGRGETLGLVGESGCGKTMTALALMGLLPIPPMRVARGVALLDGRDLLSMDERELETMRGGRIAMVFQEPMTSLNPVLSVGTQIEEPLRWHLGLGRREAQTRAVHLLERVGIPEPARIAQDYPHRLSGGMRQRVVIAMAIACRPDVLIADEPTTALDVTIQAQILDLLRDLQDEIGMAILFITHDLAVIAETADRVAVMYAGRVVETAPAATLFAAPRHPYTRGLLDSIPRITRERAPRLREVPGSAADRRRLGAGCAFAARCPEVMPRCRNEAPPLTEAAPEEAFACWARMHG
ncbi:MAG TPA: ABC transporter ATP-binding protein [Acetobacteraceae bacterium]|nr:ABC transporter ATP-binding protein [Acetobacteraceae bacterium]